ncbi:MAG: response regulator [Bacteroidales bacterium]|nr:response regulator [Bacteroidales bacterium]
MSTDSLNGKNAKNYNFSGATILLVEDDKINMLLLRNALEIVNVHVLTAENGAEALGFVHKDPSIKAILMDIKMPIMDGLEATKAIKQKQPNLPVIIQTAYAHIGEKQDAYSAGCDAYLVKPINIAQLYSTLQQLL